ncbi:hypothetical protein J6590_001964 [Homalodisca vitripennis]|nr:hypothetical protein J6590_001964 [Homalodisca vitripennis]
MISHKLRVHFGVACLVADLAVTVVCLRFSLNREPRTTTACQVDTELLSSQHLVKHVTYHRLPAQQICMVNSVNDSMQDLFPTRHSRGPSAVFISFLKPLHCQSADGAVDLVYIGLMVVNMLTSLCCTRPGEPQYVNSDMHGVWRSFTRRESELAAECAVPGTGSVGKYAPAVMRMRQPLPQPLHKLQPPFITRSPLQHLTIIILSSNRASPTLPPGVLQGRRAFIGQVVTSLRANIGNIITMTKRQEEDPEDNKSEDKEKWANKGHGRNADI